MKTEENNKSDESIDQTYTYDDVPKKSDKYSFPIIAGVLLLIAGVLALISFIQVLTINVNTLGSVVDISQLETLNVTPEQLKDFLHTCAIIGCIISVFTILGGILSFRKKLWGMALACSIIGLFTFGPMLISSILCLIALILIAISKQEFQ